MRYKKPESTGVVSVNMTPMIDMVFNLLIFFILTAQFVKLDVEEVVLPVSATAELKDYTSFRNVVINVVNPDNPSIIVMNRTYTPPELTELLKSLHDEPGSENMNVILRADQNIPYEDVARVMLATGAAKIMGWWITAEREKIETNKAS
jgi:biopolymer transport protein ExbD